MTDGTLPVREVGQSILSLRVEVLEGPDQGLSMESEEERVTLGTSRACDVVLQDPTVSRFHLEVQRRGDQIQIVDHGSTNGVYVGGLMVEKGRVAPGTVLSLGHTKVRIGDGQKVMVETHWLDDLHGLRGRSPVVKRLMARIERLAPRNVPVLIMGESGTGKELIARAIHACSERASGPIVTVDCASLSPNLIASELFGHERGAFTGAERQRIGAFEQAHGGTVFLDEIGELPAANQAQLLGVLERRRFRRVGGDKELSVDVRVVSATNRDLWAEVNAGNFRDDLHYRLAVVTLEVPPLRERAEDIPLLVRHFLEQAGDAPPVEQLFPPEAMQQLVAWRWPGNVRELRNFVEATLAMGEQPTLRHGDTEQAPASAGGVEDLSRMPFKHARDQALRAFEERYLKALLDRNKGNVSKAAREAELHRSYLFDLLKRHHMR